MLCTQILQDKEIKIVKKMILGKSQKSKEDKMGEGGQAKVFKVTNKDNNIMAMKIYKLWKLNK